MDMHIPTGPQACSLRQKYRADMWIKQRGVSMAQHLQLSPITLTTTRRSEIHQWKRKNRTSF